MARAEQTRELPRLLGLDDPPPLARLRWSWRYVHRWRRRLYHLWQSGASEELDNAGVARAVDELTAVFFLVEHLRREGCPGLPLIQDVCQSASRPSVSNVAGAVAEMFSSRILATALDPRDFADGAPISHLLFRDNWERRLGDAT